MTRGMHGRFMCGRGACLVGGICGRGCVWQGVSMVGSCMAGGMHGRGHAWQGKHGRGYAWLGVCVAGEMATAAGGMHPTGMHSC